MSSARPVNMDAPLLDVRGLWKRFGGVVATAGVDLQLRAGELHALIGPNGAGKTTLVSQLAGQLASDRGRIVFAGEDITRLVAHERARRGLVRSFQITRLFTSFDVLDNVALALQATSGRGALSPWHAVARDRDAAERARALLADLGLAERASARIEALSHGEQRALEVALALAGAPRLVLLDEPMAGLGPDESRRMEALIGRVRERATLLLIEHDVEAVFRLADRVSVLVAGQVIASGAPAEVRREARVVDAYLGKD
ncbi:MAG: ABC transporter ATP-binding protein [Betaproteobacteria bacterium]